MIKGIRVYFIPHSQQRYETCGDWKIIDDILTVYVSDLEDCYMNTLIALHEQIEAILCVKRGIKEEDVTNFDIEFEKNREEGYMSEPGDNFLSPYKGCHRFAENIERQVCHELGIDWFKYGEIIDKI